MLNQGLLMESFWLVKELKKDVFLPRAVRPGICRLSGWLRPSLHPVKQQVESWLTMSRHIIH